MRDITLIAPSYTELQAVYMARSLYLPKQLPNYTEEQENDIFQRFSIGYNAYKEKDELKTLIEEITDYRSQLKALGMNDTHLRDFSKGRGLLRVLLHLFISIVRLIFSLCLVSMVF